MTSLAACSTCETEEFDIRKVSCSYETQFNNNPFNNASYFFNVTKDFGIFQSYIGNSKLKLRSISVQCWYYRNGFPGLKLGFYKYGNSIVWDPSYKQRLFDTSVENLKNDGGFGISDGWNGTYLFGSNQGNNGISYCYMAKPHANISNFPVSTDKTPMNNSILDMGVYQDKGIVSQILGSVCFTSTKSQNDFTKLSSLDTVRGTMRFCRVDFCAKHYDGIWVNNTNLSYTNVTTIPLKDGPYTSPDNMTLLTTSTPPAHLSSIANMRFSVSLRARDAIYKIMHLGGWYDIYASDPTIYTDWPTLYAAAASTLTTEFIQARANPSHSTTTGPGMMKETYVHVRWEWLIMPLLMILCTAVVLALTIVQSWGRRYLYKSSALALLFRGMEGWEAAELRASADQKGNGGREMESHFRAIASGYRARLGRDGEGDLKFMKVE